MGRNLIILGVVLIVAGLLWPWLQKIPLGHLPGDINIKREGYRVFIPITTCLLISGVLSFIFWWFRK